MTRSRFSLYIGIISEGTSQQVAIYDSHSQKAINIDSIVIRNGYIVITIKGNKYLMNKSTDFQVLIEQDLFFRNGSTITQRAFIINRYFIILHILILWDME